ncbi:hypothetical protein HGB07_05770 [Candidatus Roizmanbacteria bacterium]|nr:hypothetical protein [Candidatus Roizmanbacteria bacterium]
MDKRKCPHTEEHKEKIRLAQIGISRPQTTGKNNGFWKGEKSKYSAHHMWILSKKGKPQKCEHCGREKP